jgi:hypothetical protein
MKTSILVILSLISFLSFSQNSQTSKVSMPNSPGIYFLLNNKYVLLPNSANEEYKGITNDWLNVANKAIVQSTNPIFLLNGWNTFSSYTSTIKTKEYKFTIISMDSKESFDMDYNIDILDSEKFLVSIKCNGHFKPGKYAIIVTYPDANMHISIIDDKGNKHLLAMNNQMKVIGEIAPICIFLCK